MRILQTALLFFIATNTMGKIIADFEGGDYGDWKVEGEAFGSAPARGTLKKQGKVEEFRGRGLVNSYFNGDNSTGKLISPEFKVSQKYITFLIGGGGWKGETCINLVVDGKIVLSATGPNVVSGGSENLDFKFWDVSRWMNKNAHIEIVDSRKGCWGHINVDHIEMRDELPPQPRKNVVHPLTVNKRFMKLPIKNGAKKCNMEIRANGEKTHFFNIELAPDKPDWWAFTDLQDHLNNDIEIRVDKLTAGSKALENIYFSENEIDDTSMLYKEELRPQFHFSARRGWNNDPNGLCYYNGEYHLFFQHNPYGTRWGNMHWGHAVSTDLIHWKELPEALYPDNLGPMYSGSAVVDHNNTSGFGQDGTSPLVLIYTAAGNPATQCIAYSNDGRNFTKFNGNPVVKNITGGNRDPKVFWHTQTKRWVMVLYVTRDNGRHTTEILTSEDLKEWKSVSSLKGGSKEYSKLLYECPDLFLLKVEEEDTVKWVTFGASLDYLIGDFDGNVFKPESKGLPGCTTGSKIYAAQTYSDHPQDKRILIGWLRAEAPGMPFNQCMTIPQELGLKRTKAGLRLTHQPVKSIESLRQQKREFSAKTLNPDSKSPISGFTAQEQELIIKANLSFDAIMAININGIKLGYLSSAETLSINGHKVKWPANNGLFDVRVFIDRTCIEIFSGDGLLYGTYSCIQSDEKSTTSIKIIEGEASDIKGEIYSLKSIWK